LRRSKRHGADFFSFAHDQEKATKPKNAVFGKPAAQILRLTFTPELAFLPPCRASRAVGRFRRRKTNFRCTVPLCASSSESRRNQ